ncbi:hypothetical protein DNK47_01375 [Mycoplasma wenyonii]|uniref:Uncharacterized protein n=1 Tax=Mycoplasma wenyonii TaxID=65123 RepID=A0A328PJ56_9MOLU|nr:hypothetical protein [Mycoplasma wenyonii]RAO95123.1 hypothetical protein DNK47_01375 [Mycoplasma wenyonii]
MSKFLALGVVSTSPLIASSAYYFWSQKNRYKNLDPTIILVSKADGSFIGSCSQYTGGAIGEGHQQEFSNSDDLLRYIFPNIDQSTPNSLVVTMSPEKLRHRDQAGRQPITIRKELQSDQDMQKTFKEYWELWISDWSPREKGVKRVVYTDKRFESGGGNNIPKLDKLYKCHKGTTWYSLQFNVLDAGVPRN